MRKPIIIVLSISGIITINFFGFLVTSRLSGGVADIVRFIPSILASTLSSSIALFIALMNLVKTRRVEWDLCPSLVSWNIVLEMNVSNLNNKKMYIESLHSKYFTSNKLNGKDEVKPYKASSVKYELSPINGDPSDGNGLPFNTRRIQINVVYYFEGSSKRIPEVFKINNPYRKQSRLNGWFLS